MDNTKKTNRKISIRQVMILFFFTVVSCTLRITTVNQNNFFAKSSWLSPFFAVIPMLLLIFILDKLIKKHQDKSLTQIIEIVFGKIIGKIILFLFFIHVLFYISFFLKNFGEKFVSSIFPDVSPMFFIILLILSALFAVKKNIESFARFAEFSFFIILIVFIAAFFTVLPNIEIKNLYPVTYYDVSDILKSSLPLISIWSPLTFSLFLGDNIRYSGKPGTEENNNTTDKFKHTAVKFMIITAIFNLLCFIAVIGIFNADTANSMPMSYFMIFKSIKSSGIIQSFETLFIFSWVFTDFIIVVYYMFIMSKIFKTLFVIDHEKTKFFMVPLAFIILILTFIIGENNSEAEFFYTNILSFSSVVLGYIFPFLLVGVGKVRRVL